MDDIKLNFAHVCDYAFNGENGKLCIIGIFKNVNVLNSNQPHPQMFIATNVSVKSGKDYKQTIRLVKEDKPEDDIMPPIEFPFSMSREGNPNEVEVGFIGQINNIKFKDSGVYEFKIYIDEIFLKSVQINVVVSSQ